MFADIIAKQLQLRVVQVSNTIDLLNGGATVPFIARYRKEVTGSLDEVVIGSIKSLYEKYVELQRRKDTIIITIEEQGKLTEELKKRIVNCYDSVELEDLYMPYRPKRRTRATIAKERGLEPLADFIFRQQQSDVEKEAESFINDNVDTIEIAISGACDIIAEKISEEESVRSIVRNYFQKNGIVSSKIIKGKEADGIKYSDYYEVAERVNRVSSHRLLAMMRGEEEGFLRVVVSVEQEPLLIQLYKIFIKRNSATRCYMENVIRDSYKRLIEPSIANEIKNIAKTRADDEAIAVFAENLRQLLLSAPLGQKRVLAVDPGFRTGCKVVVLDEQGNLITHTVIYPHPPHNERETAASCIEQLVKDYAIEAFAIGNGTAGRETETFIRNLKLSPHIFVVNEDGASVYSASVVAREEFPNEDVTVRGAVSIGRRLIDPLSELVKIEPRSIGVGQYQHSVDQTKLKERLDTVVESCVNMVGVNVNTATKQILTHISGLGPVLATNIVNYRAVNGKFRSRTDLLKVPRLGNKAFEQAAGFLRVLDGDKPLDATAVHPESYDIVERMAKDCGVTLETFVFNSDVRSKIHLEDYATETVGIPTLTDIMDALNKRGLDPRTEASEFSFDSSVHNIEDLRPGMVLPGLVTNITSFGAFVNIGVHQDGLVHISQLADKYISSPVEVVKLGQQVTVKVLDVDLKRKRISLTIKGV